MPFINIVFLRAFRAAISLASLVVTAKYIGVTVERDAWILALTAIGIVSVFLFNPTLEIFRTKIVQVQGELSPQASRDAVASYVSSSLLVAVLVSAGVILFPGLLAGAVGASAEPHLMTETVRYVQWAAAYVAITQLTNSWSSVLNSDGVYAKPEIIGIGAAVVNVICLLWLVETRGADALLISLMISSLLHCGLLGVLVYRLHPTLFITRRIDLGYMSRFVLPALPLYASFAAGQLALVVEKSYLVLGATGSVSIYDYAKKFADVPYGVLIATAAALVGPGLARLSGPGSRGDFSRNALAHLRSFIVILLPSTVVLNIGAPILVQLFFGNSVSITETDKAAISALMSILAWGLVGVSVYAVGSQALLSRGKIAEYAKIGVGTQLTFIIIVWLFSTRVGIGAIAYAWGVSHGLTGLLMLLRAELPLVPVLRVIGSSVLLHAAFVALASAFDAGLRVDPLLWLAPLALASIVVSVAIVHRASRPHRSHMQNLIE